MTFFLEKYSCTFFSPFVFPVERLERANAQKLIKFSVVFFVASIRIRFKESFTIWYFFRCWFWFRRLFAIAARHLTNCTQYGRTTDCGILFGFIVKNKSLIIYMDLITLTTYILLLIIYSLFMYVCALVYIWAITPIQFKFNVKLCKIYLL